MSKLQRIQNSAARLVCSTPRFNHITPVIFSLHWLPVAYRIELKIFVLTFKAVYQLAPPYICNSSINKRNVNTSFVLLKNYYCSCPSNQMSTAPESQKRNDKRGGPKFSKIDIVKSPNPAEGDQLRVGFTEKTHVLCWFSKLCISSKASVLLQVNLISHQLVLSLSDKSLLQLLLS